MMVTEKLKVEWPVTNTRQVEGGDVLVDIVTRTDEITVARLPFRKRTRLFAGLRGTPQNPGGIIEQAEFTVAMIQETVVKSGSDGRFVAAYSADDIDLWDDAQREAYLKAILSYQTPALGSVLKNSETTPTASN